MATRQATQLETPARAREGNTERDRERDTESMTERQREPEPELEPPHIDGAAPFHTQKAHTKPGGISSLYADYPAAVTEDLLMGGCRGVVATRDIMTGERVLRSAPLGIAVDWRHKATGCAHCFATREADDGPAGDVWSLRCEVCRSCYYCSAECMACAAPKHALECGALCAVERRTQLKNPERTMGRLLISMLATLLLPCEAGHAPLPTLDHLLELWPDQPEKEGAKQRTKQRITVAKFILAHAGDELLAALPPGSTQIREALLTSVLARCPMNNFGLWATEDGEDCMAGSGIYPAAAMFNHSCTFPVQQIHYMQHLHVESVCKYLCTHTSHTFIIRSAGMPNIAHQYERHELAFYAMRPIEAVRRAHISCLPTHLPIQT